MRTATCVCGQLGAECEGEPLSVSLCHCRACRKRTGSAFGIAAFFARSAVATSGQARTFTRPSDSGHPVTFHFCAVCGSTVYWEPERFAGLIAVAAGAFADPDFPGPDREVYADDRLF